MYITETTDNVRKLVEELEQKEDLNKLKFLIYIFGLLNNNQINDKNEANPNLVEDDDMEIFTLETIGLSQNVCPLLLQYFTMRYNKLTFTESAYEDNGNVLGIEYDDNDKKIISQFMKLNFKEKLDLISESFIKIDNETFFEKDFLPTSVPLNISGFDVACLIQKYKNNK